MPESTHGLRPQVETFSRDGLRLTVVDGARILADAAEHPLEVFHDLDTTAPVRAVRISVATGVRDSRRYVLLDADVLAGGASRTGRPTLGVVGSDPIGALLTRWTGPGGQRVAGVVDGLESAVGQVSRRLGIAAPAATPPIWEPGAPVGTRVDADAVTGLRTTVTEHAAAAADTGRVVTLRAAVPAGTATPAHLAALLAVVVRVVDDLGGQRAAEPTAGRTFTLSRHPLDPAAADTGPRPVSLDQVGGLDDVVARFRDVATSFRHPGTMARWGARRPQGILLYGPPGTGKTMLARALATEIGGTLREIRTPEILDKWLGASERNIKRIFREARRYRTPTVLLFDEFDSIISYAGAGDDSGSRAINAVAGIFKQEMNTLIEENPSVIVVATTNFPHLIDDSLIRSGRFDVKLEIPLPDAAGRRAILARMIRDLIAAYEVPGFRMFADDLDLGELAALSDGRSGADLREVLRRAQMAKAMREARTGERSIPIGQDDLRAGLRDLG